MRRRFLQFLLAFTLVGVGSGSAPALLAQAKLEPLVYDISFPDPASKTFHVDVTVPTGTRASVDLMMAIWSPGFYGLQNYADKVTAFAAKLVPFACQRRFPRHVIFNVNGPGVPPENRTNIFKPYFTTTANGTGLGLATCYAIVVRLSGEISVRSTVGLRSEFIVTLPAVDVPVDDPAVVHPLVRSLLVENRLEVVALLEVGVDVLLPVELADDEVEILVLLLRHVLDEQAPGHGPPLDERLEHAEHVAAPLRLVGQQRSRRVEDARRDEPAGAPLQAVGLGEVELGGDFLPLLAAFARGRSRGIARGSTNGPIVGMTPSRSGPDIGSRAACAASTPVLPPRPGNISPVFTYSWFTTIRKRSDAVLPAGNG